MRDSESGLERLAIGHHIGDRAHIMERSRNRRTGDREDRQDFINLDESESLGQKDDGRDPLFSAKLGISKRIQFHIFVS